VSGTFEAIPFKLAKTYLHDEYPGFVFIRFDGGDGDVSYIKFSFVEFLEFSERMATQALKLGQAINSE
jgi:hypothetical protein